MSFATAVGIDVEVYNSRRDFTGIAAAAFGPEEQMAVAGEGASAFYRIWTLREAMAKASGAGIAEVADRTDRVGKSPKEGAWRQRVGTTCWWLAHGTPVSGLSFAVALVDAGTLFNSSFGCGDVRPFPLLAGAALEGKFGTDTWGFQVTRR